MQLRGRLRSGATLLGGTALQRAAGQTAEAFRGMRALLSDDEQPLSCEQFLVALVHAVRADEKAEDRSARDVFETARRRRRRLGLASFGAGPLVGVATQLTDLYCETATVCDLADVHAPGLEERQIAAHLLVLWTIAGDVGEAQGMVDGTSERTVARILADRVVDRAATHVPERVTKLSAIKALWNARGAVGDVRRAAGKGSLGGVVFTGHRTKQFIKQAERQLGVATGEARPAAQGGSMSPLFSRKPKLHTCFFCSEQVEDATKMEHYQVHLIEVTDDEGRRAFTFECPRCGPMDRAWGGGRPNPEGNGVTAIAAHLLQSHHLSLLR